MHSISEVKIQKNHFTKCTNNECESIFALKLDDVSQDLYQLCPKCKVQLSNSHVVQCENCQTIVNFIPALPLEETMIYYVENCKACSIILSNQKVSHPTQYIPKSYM